MMASVSMIIHVRVGGCHHGDGCNNDHVSGGGNYGDGSGDDSSGM